MMRLTAMAALLGLLLAASEPAFAGEGLAAGTEATLPDNGPGEGIRGEPAVAFGGDVYLVAWREGWHGDGGNARIHAARVSNKDGKVLDGKSIALADGGADVQDRPRVAFGGGQFLVVWQELAGGKQYDVRGVVVTPDGKVQGKPFAIAAGPESEAMPEVASDGNAFVAVWQEAVAANGAVSFQINAAAITDGSAGTPERLFTGSNPLVAWDGQSYLVFANPTIGVRLDAAGKPAGAKPKALWSTINMGERTLAMAGGKGGWLVLSDRSQPDYWGWGGPGAIRAFQITPGGELDPAVPKDAGSPNARQPAWLDWGKDKKAGDPWPCGASAAVWDGKQYVAVWQRHHITQTVMFTNCDLIAGRVEGWKPLDEAGVPIAAAECEEKAPALASDGDGGLLCTFERYAKDGAVQIGARVLSTK